jgi:hypothetical protein
MTGTGNLNGLEIVGAGTGLGLKVTGSNTLLVTNVTQINAVSTGSVTTVNANIGETQPINFTGAGASALVQVDTRDFLGHAVVLDGNNYPGVNLVDIAGAAVSTSTAQIGANLVTWEGTAPNALIAGRVDANVGSVTSGVVAADVWNAVRTSYTVAGSFGRALQITRDGTAQAGAAGTITLDSGASAVTNFYNNDLLEIIGGTGIGQSRFITAYNASTKVATMSSNWATNPDNTSVFAIHYFDAVPGATAPTAAQNATAVWQDLTAGTDFGTAGSIGALLKQFTFTGSSLVQADVIDWHSGAVPAPNVTGVPKVDVTDWLGTAVTAATAGIPDVNTKNIANAAVSTTVAQIGVNLVNISGSAVSTTSAQLGVNTVQINAISTSSVTTINANQGTTQPVNFTGTAGAALVQCDTRDFLGQAVVLDGNNFPGVNIRDILGTASAGAAGYVGIDWGHINAPTSTVNLSGTTIGTVTTVTNQLTVAQIATGIWQDLLSGADFGVAGSIGLLLKTDIDTNIGSRASATVAPSWYTAPTNLTAAAIATGVWTDAVAGDFTATGSIGKSLGGAFTALGTSVYTAAALANAPSGGTPPTVGQIATAVWQDALSTDFNVMNSIGKSLYNAFTLNTSVYTSAALANAPTGGGSTPAQIALAVWQEALPGSFTAGQAGYVLFYATGSTPEQIAAAFLAAEITTVTSGTVGGQLAKIGTGRITTVSPVAQDGALSLVQGDSYNAAFGRALTWSDANAQTAWPDLTEAIITLEADDGTLICVGDAPFPQGTPKEVRAQPTSAEMQAVTPGVYVYNVVATYLGTGTGTNPLDTVSGRITLASGQMTVADREDLP